MPEAALIVIVATMPVVVVIVAMTLVMRDSDHYRACRRISRRVGALNLDGVAARAVTIAVCRQGHS